MESIAANMFVILKMSPAAYYSKLQGYLTALRCAISRSDVVCLLTGSYSSVQQPKSRGCKLYIEHCLRERMSADDCLK
jgi:hypothetical protein